MLPKDSNGRECKEGLATECLEEELTATCDTSNSSSSLGILLRLKNLEDVPNNFQNIQILDLSNQKLGEIPPGVFLLKHVKHLNLSNNLLQSLSDEIGKLTSLHVLDVSGNTLASLPMSVQHLKNLRKVNVSSNHLSTIPDGLEHLLQIEVLNLSGNELFDTSILCRSMRTITHLDLSSNRLAEIGNVRPPLCAGKLEYLNLSNNSLEKIPYWLFTLCSSLIELDISQNYNLSATQEKFNNLEFYNPYGKMFNSLKVLKLSDCNILINESSDLFKRCSHLEVLHVGNETPGPYQIKNLIYDVPSTLLSISSLTELYMPSASITYLPENISKLTCLKILDLNYNEIAWLSESFCELRSLSKCLLSENKLIVLPNEFGNLESLTELTLSSNCELYCLPESFIQLQNLTYLDLYDNNFDDIPMDLFAMPSLKGLDLEQNFCETNNLPNLENYKKLKDAMRCHVPGGPSRMDGMKPQPEPVEESPTSSSSTDWSGDSGDEDEKDGLETEQEASIRSNSTAHTQDEENWSTVVEDNDWVPPYTTYAFKFCIEVAHPRPQRWSVVTHRRKDFPVEEGQFEDV